MVSNKMIHYEKILAQLEFTKSLEFNIEGWDQYVYALNDIETYFTMQKYNLKLINGEIHKEDSQEYAEAWLDNFNQWYERLELRAGEVKHEGIRKSCLSFVKNYKRNFKDELYTLEAFNQSNKRVFRPTKELCEALNSTKNTTLLKDLRLPYPTIYISLPPGMLEVKVHYDPLSGNYRNREKPTDSFTTKLEGTYAGMSSPELLLLGGVFTPPSDVNPHDKYLLGTSMQLRRFELGKYKTIDDVLINYKDKVSDNIGSYALKTLLNIITYLTCTNSSVEEISPPKSGKINMKRFERHPDRTKSRLPYYLIGGDIQINNKPSSGGESTGTGRSLQTRFMVRGHYHHFWKIRTEEITDNMVIKTNDDGKVLVRKWLAPYWKGPEYGDVILKNYKVTT